MNLGNLGEFTMLELAEAVRDLMGSKSGVCRYAGGWLGFGFGRRRP